MPTSLSHTNSRRSALYRLAIAWSILGAASLLLASYTLIRWLVGGVSPGPTRRHSRCLLRS